MCHKGVYHRVWEIEVYMNISHKVLVGKILNSHSATGCVHTPTASTTFVVRRKNSPKLL